MNVRWLNNPILVVGAPRSGTTWLAKILDSHPAVLYRHEPDEVGQVPAHLTAEGAACLLQSWMRDRTLRVAGKRPFFAKSWRGYPAGRARAALAYALLAAGRLPPARGLSRRVALPDMGDAAQARLMVKLVYWSGGIAALARHLPESRLVLIQRHPAGQVHSMLRGLRLGAWELREGLELPILLPVAMQRAAASGIDAAGFAALPAAAKCAWAWVAFNEAAEAALCGLPNVMLLRFADLCADPLDTARRVLHFTGLDWHKQTERFIAAGLRHRGAGRYYGIRQETPVIPDRWRSEMPEADQRAVIEAARLSPVGRHWPDVGSLIAAD